MTKRRLSKQQLRTIQQRRGTVTDAQLGPVQQGLLIAHYGVSADVETAHGDLIQCRFRQNLGSMVCGDRVEFQAENAQSGIIINRHPRSSCLGRPDANRQLKPIAANIDQIIVMIAPQPEINFILLDSYLVLAETLGIEALIILNKIDLLNAKALQACRDILKIYEDLAYQVFQVSVKDAEGLKPLQKCVQDKVQVIVGQSGVGKSSLIHYLIPDIDIRIGDLTKQARKGSHTTTTARLYHGHHGDLIDSPGIRELGLWQMQASQVAQGFREFQSYLGQCKFRDCSHHDDLGCAITAAKQSGDISPFRYQSFQKICEKL